MSCTSFILQVNNSRYIMCSGATEGEIKFDTYVGLKPISLSSCFFFSHHSYTDLQDELYYILGLYLCRDPFSLFRAESLIFLGLHTVCFSRCKPCW